MKSESFILFPDSFVLPVKIFN